MLHQSIYELDRLNLVMAPVPDAVLLERIPTGYRHLAHLRTRIGYDDGQSLWLAVPFIGSSLSVA